MRGKKTKLEAEIKADETSLARTLEALQGDFSSSSLKFFAVPLVERAELLLKDAKLDDKGVRDLTSLTLDDIIKRGTCICGQSLANNPEAIAHIEEERRYCPPESIGNIVRNYLMTLSQFGCDQERVLSGMNNRWANIYSTRERIQENVDEAEDLSKRIADFPNLSVYEGERNDIKAQLKILNVKQEKLIREDATKESEIARFRKIYDQYAASSGKNKRIMLHIRYAEEVYAWLKETYDARESEIQDSLEERVNDIFEQMYHGRRRVVIDSNYSVKLLTDFDNSSRYTGESEGLNRVKNFAFIAGLVSLAKDKIVSDTGDREFDLSSEPYPLVMDAPFSNADERHIASISRALPEASEQVIMFVMMKDWRYAEPVLRDKLGARYSLDKKSEQYSKLEEA